MQLGSDHHIPQSKCTGCGKLLDGATGADSDHMPDPGSITICIYCGHIMVFDAGLVLRDPTMEEMREIAGDERILRMQQARKDAGIDNG